MIKNTSITDSELSQPKILTYDIAPFLPRTHTFFIYHQILKAHNFIRDVKVISKNQEVFIQVERFC